jgi:hypothetical protein
VRDRAERLWKRPQLPERRLDLVNIVDVVGEGVRHDQRGVHVDRRLGVVR